MCAHVGNVIVTHVRLKRETSVALMEVDRNPIFRRESTPWHNVAASSFRRILHQTVTIDHLDEIPQRWLLDQSRIASLLANPGGRHRH
jgi:hypothetical protein